MTRGEDLESKNEHEREPPYACKTIRGKKDQCSMMPKESQTTMIVIMIIYGTDV